MATDTRLQVRDTQEELEKLDKAIKKLGYKDRADWYRDCKRQVIRQVGEHQHSYKIGDTIKNICTNEIYKVIKADSNMIVGQNSEEQRAFGEYLTYGFEDLELIESSK